MRAQAELEGLFLLYKEEVREEVVLLLVLQELQDNPTNNTCRWNVLQDLCTCKALPTPRYRWLLDRVLGLAWLCEEFLEIHQGGPAGINELLWREGPVSSTDDSGTTDYLGSMVSCVI